MPIIATPLPLPWPSAGNFGPRETTWLKYSSTFTVEEQRKTVVRWALCEDAKQKLGGEAITLMDGLKTEMCL